MNHNYHTLIFDLDDTLIETAQILFPLMYKDLAEAFLPFVTVTENDLKKNRNFWHELKPPLSFGHYLVRQFQEFIPIEQKEVLEQKLNEIHDEKTFKTNLQLSPAVSKILQSVRLNRRLILVTLGSSARQSWKVQELNLKNYFDEIFILDPKKYQTKIKCLDQLIPQIQRSSTLVIGNRRDDEIQAGIELGFVTCWLKKNTDPISTRPDSGRAPNFTIFNLEELIQTCHL